MSFFIKSVFVSWLLAVIILVIGIIIDPTMISAETADFTKQIEIGVGIIWFFTVLIEMAILLGSGLCFMIRDDIKNAHK